MANKITEFCKYLNTVRLPDYYCLILNGTGDLAIRKDKKFHISDLDKL